MDFRKKMGWPGKSAVAFWAALIAPLAWADYPERAITMIVPFPPGGVADVVGRPVADALAKKLGQPMVVENKAGAGGALGITQAARAPADGYTLLMALSSISILPEADRLMERKPGFSLGDFKPIARITADPTVLAVRGIPWKAFWIMRAGIQESSTMAPAAISARCMCQSPSLRWTRSCLLPIFRTQEADRPWRRFLAARSISSRPDLRRSSSM